VNVRWPWAAPRNVRNQGINGSESVVVTKEIPIHIGLAIVEIGHSHEMAVLRVIIATIPDCARQCTGDEGLEMDGKIEVAGMRRKGGKFGFGDGISVEMDFGELLEPSAGERNSTDGYKFFVCPDSNHQLWKGRSPEKEVKNEKTLPDGMANAH
jgi:hypothetical protein